MIEQKNTPCEYCGYANPKNEELQQWGWHCRGCELENVLKWKLIEGVRVYLAKSSDLKFPHPRIARDIIDNIKAADTLYLKSTYYDWGTSWNIHANCPDFAECFDLRLSLDPDYPKTTYLVALWKAIESISKMPITNVAGAAEYLLSGLKYYSGEFVQIKTAENLHDASDSEIIEFVETAIDDYIKEFLS